MERKIGTFPILRFDSIRTILCKSIKAVLFTFNSNSSKEEGGLFNRPPCFFLHSFGGETEVS
jgi:hypothetical protein